MVIALIALVVIIIVSMIMIDKRKIPFPIISHEVIVWSEKKILEQESRLMEGEVKNLSVIVIALLEDGNLISIDLKKRFLLFPEDPMIVNSDRLGNVIGVFQGASSVSIKSKHRLVMKDSLIGKRKFVVSPVPHSIDIVMISTPEECEGCGR